MISVHEFYREGAVLYCESVDIIALVVLRWLTETILLQDTLILLNSRRAGCIRSSYVSA